MCCLDSGTIRDNNIESFLCGVFIFHSVLSQSITFNSSCSILQLTLPSCLLPRLGMGFKGLYVNLYFLAMVVVMRLCQKINARKKEKYRFLFMICHRNNNFSKIQIFLTPRQI